MIYSAVVFEFVEFLGLVLPLASVAHVFLTQDSGEKKIHLS